MTKSKKKAVYWVAVIVLAAAIVILFGKSIFDYANEQYIRLTHPMKYTEYVEKYAAEFEIDPYLVYAVIKTESGYDPDAVSNVGARGLMQIMESTFDWIKYRLDDDETMTFDSMYDPESNIRYGCYLLGYLMRYYGTQDSAICAYHAGIGNVDSWLENTEYSNDGVNLIKIPTSDTAHYLDKINNAEKNYIKLYKTEVEQNG